MIPQTLTNFNLFVDGKGYVGLATEVNLPKLKRKTEEHRAGGMDGPIKMGLGMEMLEAGFTLTGVSKDVLVFFGVADDTGQAVRGHGNGEGRQADRRDAGRREERQRQTTVVDHLAP